MAKPASAPPNHPVNIGYVCGELTFGKAAECFCVRPGDTITWKLQHKMPFFITIKSLISPLDITTVIRQKGEDIEATVLRHAVPGIYKYAVGAWDGKELLVLDPEIIVRPPDGRG